MKMKKDWKFHFGIIRQFLHARVSEILSSLALDAELQMDLLGI